MVSVMRYVDKQWRLANHRLCLFLERCCMGVVCQIKDLDNSSAVALSQSAFASMLRFLGEPCMGVVSQIKDLDNSSSAVPYKTHISSTDEEQI